MDLSPTPRLLPTRLEQVPGAGCSPRVPGRRQRRGARAHDRRLRGGCDRVRRALGGHSAASGRRSLGFRGGLRDGRLHRPTSEEAPWEKLQPRRDPTHKNAHPRRPWCWPRTTAWAGAWRRTQRRGHSECGRGRQVPLSVTRTEGEPSAGVGTLRDMCSQVTVAAVQRVPEDVWSCGWASRHFSPPAPGLEPRVPPSAIVCPRPEPQGTAWKLRPLYRTEVRREGQKGEQPGEGTVCGGVPAAPPVRPQSSRS